MKRILGPLMLVAAALLAACDTEPPANVTTTDADLKARVGCTDTTGSPPAYDAWWRITYRKAGQGSFGGSLQWHAYHCDDGQGPHYLPGSPFTEHVSNLDPGAGYEYRLEISADGQSLYHWYDKNGNEDGTTYETFTTQPVASVTPKKAFALSDSIGVATHPTYFDTPGHACSIPGWSQCGPAGSGEAHTAQLIAAAGIKHVRNGMAISNDGPWNTIVWDNMQAWPRVGITSSWGVDDCTVHAPGNTHNTIDEYLAKIAEIDMDKTDAIEGTNEPNYFCTSYFPTQERAYQLELYQKVKAHSDPVIRSSPVLGPSFIFDGASQAGDYSDRIDLRNTHPYTGCSPPTPQHVQTYGIDSYNPADPANHPTWVTEFGFHTALRYKETNADEQPACDERTAAIYTLRQFLEHLDRGIKRSYLYEAIDLWPDPNDNHGQWQFGILRADFTPKPAYTAIKNLISAVGYGQPSTTGLRMSIEQAPSDVRSMVLQQDATHYVVALWRTSSVWNRDTQQVIPVPGVTTRLLLPDATAVESIKPLDSATGTGVPISNRRVTVSLDGDPVLLRVTR